MITIEQGRKAYNAQRIGSPETALEVRHMKDHEAAVAAFFAQCEAEKPDETARVFAKYPVLTERQLDDRRKRELHSFGNGEPEDNSDDYTDADRANGLAPTLPDLANAASLRVHEILVERQEEARRRGEPIPLIISSWTW